jgi:hypothetical protein
VHRTAVAAAALALVAVFAAITVSVVNARRPLDGAVAKSFDSTASQVRARAATVSPHGCHSTQLDFYACRAVVGRRHRGAALSLLYRLALTDDGCWTAIAWPVGAAAAAPPPLRTRLARLRGCTEGAR